MPEVTLSTEIKRRQTRHLPPVDSEQQQLARAGKQQREEDLEEQQSKKTKHKERAKTDEEGTFTITANFISYTLLELGRTPFCLQGCFNSS